MKSLLLLFITASTLTPVAFAKNAKEYTCGCYRHMSLPLDNAQSRTVCTDSELAAIFSEAKSTCQEIGRDGSCRYVGESSESCD